MIHLFAFLKLLGDAGLWYAAAGLIMGLGTTITDMTMAAVLIAIGGGLGDFLDEKKENLRYLAVIPGLLTLIFCHGIGDFLVLLPPIVYLGLCIHRKMLQPDSTELFYKFRSWAFAAIVVSILCALRHMDWAFLLCILSLTVNVFLMRMLRHDPYDLSSRKLISMELGLLALVLIVCLLLSRDAALQAGLAVLKAFYNFCIYPIFMLLVTLSLGAFLALTWVLHFFAGKQQDFENPAGEMAAGAMEQFFEETQIVQHPFLSLLIRVAGALIFFVAAYFLFRHWLESAAPRGRAKKSDEKRVQIPISALRKPETVSFFDRGVEAKIRRAYASYCRAVTQVYRNLLPSDTTRSVNLLAHFDTDAEAVELRQLYTVARYEMSGKLTSADAGRAAALSKSLCKRLKEAEE